MDHDEDEGWVELPWPIHLMIVLAFLVAGFLFGNIYANWGVVCR